MHNFPETFVGLLTQPRYDAREGGRVSGQTSEFSSNAVRSDTFC